jgi:hypothetical protein
MDPIKNPFSPGAGSPSPELVGRDPILEQARILLGRVKQNRGIEVLCRAAFQFPGDRRPFSG